MRRDLLLLSEMIDATERELSVSTVEPWRYQAPHRPIFSAIEPWRRDVITSMRPPGGGRPLLAKRGTWSPVSRTELHVTSGGERRKPRPHQRHVRASTIIANSFRPSRVGASTDLGTSSAEQAGKTIGARYRVSLPPGPMNNSVESHGEGHGEGHGERMRQGPVIAARVSAGLVPWCSLECTPACQAGGRGFKSRRDRHAPAIAAGASLVG